MDIKNLINTLNINLDKIKDVDIKQKFLLLFNIIEKQNSLIQNQQLDIQKLRDETNRLKGEQGKPNIKPNKKKNKNISSEKERKKKKKRKKSKNKKLKQSNIKTIEKVCKVDPTSLPSDASFNGYEPTTVYGIKIEPIKIVFKKEIYYSPSNNKTYRGQLPPGYEGGFSPELKAHIINFKYIGNMSQPKILELLLGYGIPISSGSISNILIKDKDDFHKEKNDIYLAGLASSYYQQIDDTGARVNGKNHYVHVVCNDLYTAYFTTRRKNRLTILDILRNFRKRRFCINEKALQLLDKLRLPAHVITEISKFDRNKNFTTKEIIKLLKNYFPQMGKLQKTRILEATGVAYYHTELEHPIVEVLLGDDAAQFKSITEKLALCWIHDGRHYKKLNPIVLHYVKILNAVLKKYWIFYRKLLSYKKNPTDVKAKLLSEKFDALFSTQTGYNDLDARIAKTKAKKEELLLVLEYPDLPLHNNGSELEERIQVRFRDVSLHTITDEGTKAKDTFLTILRTARKLDVSTYEYILDRVRKKYEMQSLADIIREKSPEKGKQYYDSS